jgi:hypothetical protein
MEPMSEAFDIRELLDRWPYDPDRDVRIVRNKDGREFMQVRTPLGLEQLEMEGRPDGTRPHELESVLDFYQLKLARMRDEGREAGFKLSGQECAELFGEGTLYYFRYLRLFQLERWAETVRDTGRNLQLFDFIRRYAARQKDRDYLEKWRPYLLRVNAVAAAMHLLTQGEPAKALKMVETAREKIEDLDELDDDTFRFERDRSLTALRELEQELQRKQPISALERLQRELRRAVDRQEFERAAELRDQIRDLRAREKAGE